MKREFSLLLLGTCVTSLGVLAVTSVLLIFCVACASPTVRRPLPFVPAPGLTWPIDSIVPPGALPFPQTPRLPALALRRFIADGTLVAHRGSIRVM